MTDAITLVDFVGTFEAKTRSIDMPDCHPSAASNIHWWLAEMRDAKLATMVQRRSRS